MTPNLVGAGDGNTSGLVVLGDIDAVVRVVDEVEPVGLAVTRDAKEG